VEQHCLRYLDGGDGPFATYRCAEFERPATCRSTERRPMRFCMDVDEQGATRADPRPASHVSYDAARQACAVRGARMCTESEFHFACEGEEMRPYPYGWSRDATACNIDRLDLGQTGDLKDLREEVGARPRCASPFGVRDLTGNLEEWVTADRPGYHHKSTILMGAWWLPGRSTCRQTNGGHDGWYQGAETGYRCCL
jgi:formylglycine-generating enzyme required for sulfatase activity